MSGLKRDRGQWPSRDNSLVDPIECLQSHVNTDRGPQGLDKIKKPRPANALGDRALHTALNFNSIMELLQWEKNSEPAENKGVLRLGDETAGEGRGVMGNTSSALQIAQTTIYFNAVNKQFKWYPSSIISNVVM